MIKSYQSLKGVPSIMEEWLKKFYTSMSFQNKIVGIKFLYKKKEFNKSKIAQSKTKLSYCMMVKVACSGKAIKVREKNFLCSSSARTFGILEFNDHISSGKEYYSYNMYDSLKTAKDVQEGTVYLSRKIYGLIAQPIENYEVEPDIVILITNPYNVMRVVQGYSYTYGRANNISFVGNQGVCSELTAKPFESNDINISVLCSNTRFSCKWKDSDMGISMPYKMFINVAKGVLETLNATEPDKKKEEIIKRSEESEVKMNIVVGKNYYESSLGVSKLE